MPLLPSSSIDTGMQIELSPEVAARKKRERQIQLNTVQIPLLRFLGYGLLSIAIHAYNHFLGDPSVTIPTRAFVITAFLYCIFSAITLKAFYARIRLLDLELLFLLVDLVLLTLAVYVTGGEKSWLVALLMLRTADQTPNSFRRSLFFAHFTILCYLVLVAYLDFGENRAIDWPGEITKCALLYFGNLYIAITALGSSVRRRKLGRMVAMARDLIRRLEKTSDDLASARVKAEAANEAKSRFLANMSHEIRTPMNAVIGLSDLMIREQLQPKQRQSMEILRSSAQALLRVIDDILDFSKIEAGKMTLEVVACDLPTLLEEVRTLLDPRTQAKQLSLQLEITDDLPRFIKTDPVRLRQILLNLVGNAVKFTEQGRVLIRVEKSVETGGEKSSDWIRFAIHDTGPGIPSEIAPTLFEPFSQADNSSTRRHTGTGLGLPISKRLVEMMGGEIGVEADASGGSVFWFTLPLTSARNRNTAASRSGTTHQKPGSQEFAIIAPEMLTTQDDSSAHHALIVEDNPVNRLVAAAMLRYLGITAAEAAHGGEALEALEHQHFDVILMDCQMPEMDGYQATAEIRRLEGSKRHTPIIALTAHALQGDRERCLEAGMDDYMVKPLHLEELAKVLRLWINIPPLADG